MDDSGASNLEIVVDRILFSARDLRRKLDSARNDGYRLNGDTGPDDYRAASERARNLEKENQELRQALEDHQYGLEFIMSKYRSQVFELIRLNRVEQDKTTPNASNTKRNSVD